MKEHTPGKILVVDDEEGNRNLFRDVLNAAGHTVLVAEDGRQAIALLKSQKPDVMLLDVVMPGRDGFEVCRLVRVDPETESLPILMITGLDDRETRLRGIRCGANDFITKPIDIEDTVLRVENALRFGRQLETARDKETARLDEIKRKWEPLADSLFDTFEMLAITASRKDQSKQAELIKQGKETARELIESMRAMN